MCETAEGTHGDLPGLDGELVESRWVTRLFASYAEFFLL